MSIWELLIILAAAASAPPSSVHQQPAEAHEDDALATQEVIVTGQRKSDRTVREFVDQATGHSGGQLARFQGPVCVETFGLPAAHGAVVKRRVQSVAESLGLPAAAASCRANVIIAFADNGPDFIKALKRERRSAFDGLELSELRQVFSRPGPVWAWHSVDLRGADGRPAERVSYLNVDGRILYLGKSASVIRATGGSSRLQRTTRQDLAVSFVVMDVGALDGLTLNQIADYAAMRTLARTNSHVPGLRSTILNLFTGDEIARSAGGLTRWDAAYLKALYAASHATSASHHQVAMEQIIRREIDRESGNPR